MSSPDGRWDDWYDSADKQLPYGDTDTYRLGGTWLQSCDEVEDWGCGLGWFRIYRTHGYIGIDGSSTKFADVHANLADYRSDVPGIFMRHVLEHNHRWPNILDNAVASFRQRMALILFTPLADRTQQIGETVIGGVSIPDYSFALDDILARFEGAEVGLASLPSPGTQYGVEHVFFARKAE